MSDGWRLRYLAREAVRNVLGHGARMAPMLLLAVLLGAGAVAFAAIETAALRTDLDDLAARGRGVAAYASSAAGQPVSITRASCESLTAQPGVLAAGLVTDPVERSLEPGAIEIMTRRASTTLLPQLAHTDAVIGAPIIDRAGTFRTRIDQTLLDAQTVTEQREGLGASHSVFLALGPDDTSGPYCLAVLDHFLDAATIAPVHLAALDVAGGPLTATEALRVTSDPVEAFLARPARFLPLLLGLLGAVATVIGYRLRTSELAVYRLSGTARASMLQLLTLEILTITGAAATSATAAALTLRAHLLDPGTSVLWGLTMAGTWALVTLIATADLAVRRPTDLAKDR
ncbi:hypothetical protein [Pseudactinotalea sp. HY158]|uniref:hypothetical protein n=1 Tax=Pseudactinotalea sp. HY158 TaxID=2654547 RepID=UPI00129D1F33|nr:hypothetical protein [Pseudactinotalea sp. HY158]QGH68220.1 hypothetical protein GCE65_00820 [Pseudactinotalea sp. HY158]